MVGDYSDKGGASRFFYQAKVSESERNMGLDGFEDKDGHTSTNMYMDREDGSSRKPSAKKNFHPTIKPVNLMTYLCRLITPPGGIVLDPFMGSGTTGSMSLKNNRKFIGIELDKDYFNIAAERIIYGY